MNNHYVCYRNNYSIIHPLLNWYVQLNEKRILTSEESKATATITTVTAAAATTATNTFTITTDTTIPYDQERIRKDVRRKPVLL